MVYDWAYALWKGRKGEPDWGLGRTPSWAVPLILAKETGQYDAVGVDMKCYIWQMRQLTKMRAESKSYELEAAHDKANKRK